MKKQILFNITKKYFASPLLALAIVCFIIAGITISHQTKHSTSIKKQTIQNKITGQQTQQNQPTPKEIQTTIIAQPTATATPILPTNTPLPQPTNTPIPQPTSTPTPVHTVNMQIIDPDGTSSFSVNLNAGNNLCDNLNEAKNEGKIKSVTMTWYASFNSYYINEINGFNNNWTVTLNGTEPKVGCSLIKPNVGDTIVWKYN